jgi:hypothetical protein
MTIHPRHLRKADTGKEIIMAKILLNPLFGKPSGKIGNLVFRQHADGTTILSRAPAKSDRKPSAAQLAHQQRFREAAAYAKNILADPEGMARYQERAKGSDLTPLRSGSCRLHDVNQTGKRISHDPHRELVRRAWGSWSLQDPILLLPPARTSRSHCAHRVGGW